MSDLRQIRQTIRSARRSLSAAEHRRHARGLMRNLENTSVYRRAERIAFYLAADGEIDPGQALQRALRSGKRCYLPVLRRDGKRSLWFVAYHRKTRLQSNRFGIPEPRLRHRERVPPTGLHLIVMPLVAFDLAGHRIGMGGGYYDRTLRHLRRRRYWRAPKLVGVGHELQRIEGVTPQPWDIPLDLVVTESRCYRPRRD